MLEKISYGDLPVTRGRSANSKFASTAVEEFSRLNCDAAKVTGWPINKINVASKAASLRRAIKEHNLSARITVQRDSEYCHLVRVR